MPSRAKVKPRFPTDEDVALLMGETRSCRRGERDRARREARAAIDALLDAIEEERVREPFADDLCDYLMPALKSFASAVRKAKEKAK
jgi:hypothetical protein